MRCGLRGQTRLSDPGKPNPFKLPPWSVIANGEMDFLDSSNCDVMAECIPKAASNCGWTESSVFPPLKAK